MKAAVYDRYGSPEVVRITNVEQPAPKDDEVLLKVCAASVNPIDWHFMRGAPYIGRLAFGVSRPRNTRLGRDVAGQVEAVGKKVTQFKAGDEVFGVCAGALAEYVCTGESKLVMKPDKVTFEQAASVPIAAVTALQAVRDIAQIQAGQKLLINGAAGGVGTFAVQLAKWLGAVVTGVCSAKNVDLVRSLGADQVIDYAQEDFTRSAQHYDAIVDNVGNHSLSECRRVLKPKGKYVLVGSGISDHGWIGPSLARAMAMPVVSRFAGRQMRFVMANLNKKDMTILSELLQAGTVTPAIDRRYSLSEAAEAIRYLETGHASGKVVITMEGSGEH